MKFTLNTANKIFILISFLCTIISAVLTDEICYFFDPSIAILLFLLHLLLLGVSSLNINNRVLDVLVLTLLLFYVSRVGIMQFDLSYYSYPELPSIAEMTESLTLLLIASTGLVLGCIYQKKSARYTENIFLHKIPLGGENKYYKVIAWVVIFCKSTIIINTLSSGAGLAISLQFIDIISLRINKFVHFFNFLSIIPIAWLILKNPKGYERRLTIAAISLFCVSQFFNLSKAAFIYMTVPFILVYYISGRPVPRKVKWSIFIAICLTLFVLFPFMSYLRIYIQEARVAAAGGMIEGYKNNEHALSALVLGALHRVGISFDVLTLVVMRQSEFVAYAHLLDEFLNIINSFVPGGLIEAYRIPWAQILYSIGSGADLLAMLEIRTGENITLIGHLAIYFGWLGVFVICFILTRIYSSLYAMNDSILFRYLILSEIFFGISNGSGLVQSVSSVPFAFLYMSFIHTCIVFAWSIGKYFRISRTAQQHLI